MGKTNERLAPTFSAQPTKWYFVRCGQEILLKHRIPALSKTEAGVLRVIFEKYPHVTSREELLNEIWDDETFVEENTLNVTISRIRRRLGQVGSCLVVKSVRGVGYRIGDVSHER